MSDEMAQRTAFGCAIGESAAQGFRADSVTKAMPHKQNIHGAFLGAQLDRILHWGASLGPCNCRFHYAGVFTPPSRRT